ncbi:MAG: porin, partial [Rhodobacterales bacterium]|nr:porin [Rhodobacterales bacterium]MDX5390720.1 porin [Rhodobacterales bacterium]MDX5490421.1 porin [Rhodobacterales bacterium]
MQVRILPGSPRCLDHSQAHRIIAPHSGQRTGFYCFCVGNLLIATTALVATAGVAVADVKISGYARFGAMYDDGVAAGADEFNTRSRLRLQFDATTETDGGLTLGARQRFQTEENLSDTDGTGGNAVRFFATTGGLTVAMGNILGVIEAAPNLYLPTKSAGVGLEGNGFRSLATNTVSNGGRFAWTAYDSEGAGATDGVEVIYSMNGIGLHVHSTDDSYGVGANYKFADYTAAVAYEEFDNNDSVLFASVGGKFAGFDAALSYADTSFGGVSAEKFSLRGGYQANDALYVYGFASTENNSAGEAFGLGASYGLGGGASIE